jgi:hypothetical protein
VCSPGDGYDGFGVEGRYAQRRCPSRCSRAKGAAGRHVLAASSCSLGKVAVSDAETIAEAALLYRTQYERSKDLARARISLRAANASIEVIDLARRIGGTGSCYDQLVVGLDEQLKHLRMAIHYDSNKLSLSDLRKRAERLHRAATYLQIFPKNGQLPKAEMEKVKWEAKDLQNSLTDLDLLSYIFKDEPVSVKASFKSALDVISERASNTSIPKNGRPRKQSDIEVPHWDQFVSELHHIADLARAATDRDRVKKRMTSPFLARHERPNKSKRDKHEQRFSPELLCVVIVGAAYAAAHSKMHWLMRRVKFPKNSHEACEMLWTAADGEKHVLITRSGHRYWDEHLRAARKPACLELVRNVNAAFR